MSGVLRIGSRGSRLALIQSEWVRDELLRLHPDLRVEIEVIQTKGDKLLDAPLAKIGDKGLFTKELETAMLDGRTDLAVHSAKDMPTDVPRGLAIVAFTAREDVRDVFVGGASGPFRTIDDLPRGALVGTSSLRRRSQLLALRPDLELVDIRGNVQTRLRKVEEEGMAGTILAAAGLARLGQPELASFAFAFRQMLPAVGQGSLAIEARAGDARVAGLVTPLDPRALVSRAACRTEPDARSGGWLSGADRRLRRRLRGAGRSGRGAAHAARLRGLARRHRRAARRARRDRRRLPRVWGSPLPTS